jgi:TorA maturation chaperone TorD
VHELFRALAVLAEPPEMQTASVAASLEIEGEIEAADYTDLFVRSLYPYASVYLGAEGMLGGEARDRIAGFWRALGTQPPAEPDHLATLLGALASLLEAEGAASGASRDAWRHARQAFLVEHVASWLPPYLRKLDEIAPAPYARWGRLLLAALKESLRDLEPPEAAPSHFRESGTLTDPRVDGMTEFLASLLAPARSGLIVTANDLARAARDLELGLRYGERRYILEALLAQNPCGVLVWLAAEAERWAELHRSSLLLAGAREHWIDRAQRSAALLRSLAARMDTAGAERGF